jgi:hypothetical protein
MMIMGVVHIYERRMLDVDVVSVAAERRRLEARTTAAAAAAPRRDDEGRL